VIISLYLFVFLGTYLHLGQHDHVFSPRLNAFLHPDCVDDTERPATPVGDPRTVTDSVDHSLQFTIGDEAPTIAGVDSVERVVRFVQPTPISRHDHRVVYRTAPKQSPPRA